MNFSKFRIFSLEIRYFSFEKGGKKIGPVRGVWGGAHPGFLDESSSLRPGQHVGIVKSGCGGGHKHEERQY